MGFGSVAGDRPAGYGKYWGICACLAPHANAAAGALRRVAADGPAGHVQLDAAHCGDATAAWGVIPPRSISVLVAVLLEIMPPLDIYGTGAGGVDTAAPPPRCCR